MSSPWSTAWRELRTLLATIGRILGRRGLPLAGIAAFGLVSSYWVQELAVVVSRGNALLGLLVFALVPAISFGAVVWMMLALGHPAPVRGAPRLAVLGSALLVYLLIYEQSGQLREERRSYLWQSVYEGIWSDPENAAQRVPDLVSVPALVIVAVAFLVRVLGARLVQSLEQRPDGARTVAAGVARVVVGYAEIVWIVLAVISLLTLWDNIGTWWDSRVLVHEVAAWWAGLSLPDVPTFLGSVAGVVGTIIAAFVRGIAVPLVWIVLASLLYGVRFGDVSAVPVYLTRLTTSAGGRLQGVGRRVLRRDVTLDAGSVERSWRRLTEPEGRWDALGGALGLVLARGPVTIGVFCIVFLALSQVDLLLWDLAGLLAPSQRVTDQLLLAYVMSAITAIVPTVLAVATAAAGADLALRHAGLPSPLRTDLARRAERPAAQPTLTSATLATEPGPATEPTTALAEPTAPSEPAEPADR